MRFDPSVIDELETFQVDNQNGRQSPNLQFLYGRLVGSAFRAVIFLVTRQLFLSGESVKALFQTDRLRLLLKGKTDAGIFFKELFQRCLIAEMQSSWLPVNSDAEVQHSIARCGTVLATVG